MKGTVVFLTICAAIWCCESATVLSRQSAATKVKIDCYPDPGSTQELCEARKCTWEPSSVSNEPWCYYPDDYGFTVSSNSPSDSGINAVINWKDGQYAPYGGVIETVNVAVTYDSDTRLRIKFTDPNNERYEVPLDINEAKRVQVDNQYEVTVVSDPVFALVVKRKETGATVFDSQVSGFMFSDQFHQITTIPPTSHVYGIGEQRHQRFSHDMNFRRWSLFGRDQPPNGNVNLYGSQPFFIQLEEDGKATGVFVLNSNAMEYAMLPYPAISMRTIGGILDIFIYMGPTVDDVVKQHLATIGLPTPPPYWALGFQLSRYGYNSIDNMKAAMDRTINAGIPYDVQYTDIDTMNANFDFTYDSTNFNGLPDLINSAKEQNIHYVPIFDPAIGADGTNYPPLDQGLAQDVFVKSADGTILEGKVWPGNTYFPDFTADKTVSWWSDQVKTFHDTISFDGIWIDMNEPADFVAGSLTGCTKNNLNYPPYAAGVAGSDDGKLFDKTICMDAVHSKGIHYNLHNMYGHFEAIATNNALRAVFPGKRPMILTRSNYAGTGKYSPAHWLGDNYSTWESMRDSIPGILEFNLFGIPFVGADICGFQNNADESLCLRWMQLGAFYPFCRNHNTMGSPDQDPAVFGDAVIAASKKALTERYRLLPYLYTLLLESHLGKIGSVARSLVHEFPTDAGAYDISFQFLWGPALLISPVVEQDAVTVDAYIPDDIWYDYYTGAEVTTVGQTVTLSAPTDGNVPLHVRGGYILPRQFPAVTTTDSRKNPMGLLVSLDASGSASGSLAWDDGVSDVADGTYDYYTFSMADNTLTTTVESGGSQAQGLIYDLIVFYGCGSQPASVNVDGTDLPSSQITYDTTNKVLTLTGLTLDVTQAHTVKLN